MTDDGILLAKLEQKPLRKWWLGLKNEGCGSVSAAGERLPSVPPRTPCEAPFRL